MIDIDASTFEAEIQRAGGSLSPVRVGLLLARECGYPDMRPSDFLRQLEDMASEAQPRLPSERRQREPGGGAGRISV